MVGPIGFALVGLLLGCGAPESLEAVVPQAGVVPSAGWLRVGDRRGEGWVDDDGGTWTGRAVPWALDLDAGELVIDGVVRSVRATRVGDRWTGWVEPGPALPASPPVWEASTVGNVVVVRPTEAALGEGLGELQLDTVVEAGLVGEPDFGLVLEMPGLRSLVPGLGGFVMQRPEDVRGVGRRPTVFRDGRVRGIVWMNKIDRWTDDALGSWVFCQELGHWRAAYARIDRGDGIEDVLLGRANAHWSYLLDTGASPMEGNAWIDNGDGTFTSDPGAGLGPFHALDRYLMGWIPAEEVGPFFLIEPDDDVDPDTPPEARTGAPPVTIRGRRIDLSVEDVIRAEGEVWPGPDEVDRSLSLQTVLAAGAYEVVGEDDVARVGALQAKWVDAWDTCTLGASEVTFDLR